MVVSGDIFELKTKQMTGTIKGRLGRFPNSLLQRKTQKQKTVPVVWFPRRREIKSVLFGTNVWGCKFLITFVRIADPRGIEIPQDASGREVSMDTTHSPAYTEESDSEPAVQPQVGQLLRFLLQ